MPALITVRQDCIPKLRSIVTDAAGHTRGGVTTLARNIGVSRNTLYRWMRASSELQLSKKALSALCKAAGCNQRVFTAPESIKGSGVTSVKRLPIFQVLASHVTGKTTASRRVEATALAVFWAVTTRYADATLVCDPSGARVTVVKHGVVTMLVIHHTREGLRFVIGISNAHAATPTPVCSGVLTVSNTPQTVETFLRHIGVGDDRRRFREVTQT